MEWYVKVLKNYAVFKGRARRREYWMFVLYNIIISMILVLLTDPDALIPKLYGLAILIPTIAVTVRRLHDTGRSGWWYLISFIPIVGTIILLVFMCQDSHGHNQYGPSPKLFS